MSLFSRRSTMIVAGCALTLPLAAGTANAAFDIGGDNAAPVDGASVSAESLLSSSGGSGSVDNTLGDGAMQAGSNGARVEACAAADRPCASVRGSVIPDLTGGALSGAGKLAADAAGVVSKNGVDVQGSLRGAGERVGGSAGISTDRGSLTADTPVGNGSADLETESVDIVVD
jgi:hypothetical protein